MRKDGFTYEGGRVLCCDAFSATGLVKHGFSTKKRGSSTGIFSSLNLGVHTQDQPDNVEQNFSLFCGDVSIDPEHLVLSQQVHGTVIHRAGKEDCGKGLYRESNLKEIDGLVTNEPGVALATFYADCTPILFLDPKQKVIASVHSGWRGTVQKIAQRAAMTMMRAYGCNSEDILVAMGPSIKQCHFEVDEDVYLEFLLHFRGMAEKCTIKKNNKYYIDTDTLNVYSLLQMGILQEHIYTSKSCTYCNEELFFSHRRDGETGRMCAVIELQ
ncbi:MAG: peptidoglycan editing factor PgeF [Ruminococcaceae bacterium]|nr:peptidoglycan editing factor PgeF [Oscillospiraceae bacterium]